MVYQLRHQTSGQRVYIAVWSKRMTIGASRRLSATDARCLTAGRRTNKRGNALPVQISTICNDQTKLDNCSVIDAEGGKKNDLIDVRREEKNSPARGTVTSMHAITK